MYCFCTYFDQNYLPRGLALYHSLRKHCPDFKLWVLCMDCISYEILEKLDLPGTHPISLEEFERNDEPLLSAKKNRSRIEYYFTCTPSLPLFILNHHPEVELITYLDADLFFFADPAALFDEIENKSIAIIGHRFPQSMCHLEIFGVYNVGWMSFKRDTNGLNCLNWWRERCIEWCYDRLDKERFADQKYLDDWTIRFESVIVLEHKGANLAPWNLSNYHLSQKSGRVFVDDEPLIFFHFHALKKITHFWYNPRWRFYGVKSSSVLRKNIYEHYLRTLLKVTKQLLPVGNADPIPLNFRGYTKADNVTEIVKFLPIMFENILKRKYIFFISGHVF